MYDHITLLLLLTANAFPKSQVFLFPVSSNILKLLPRNSSGSCSINQMKTLIKLISVLRGNIPFHLFIYRLKFIIPSKSKFPDFHLRASVGP